MDRNLISDFILPQREKDLGHVLLISAHQLGGLKMAYKPAHILPLYQHRLTKSYHPMLILEQIKIGKVSTEIQVSQL